MLEGIPKISVLIICYKQEDVIKRAINSLLAQKDYIYEICVSDDCSPDRTWEVLQEYDRQHPGLFKLHRNEPNVGIFENVEYTWTMPTGDIIYRLAGDDKIGDGWLEKICDFINEKKIDYKNELFAIYGNYIAEYPNGDSFIESNRPIKKFPDVVELSYRGYVSNRSCCYSKKILEKFIPVSRGKSHIVEISQEVQLQLFSDINYYIPYVGNIYYAGVGVSVNLSIDQLKERRDIWPYTNKFLESNHYLPSKKTLSFGKYMMCREEYLINKNIHNLFRAFIFYIYSIEMKYLKYQFPVKRTVFAILRRLPHKTRINW